MSSSSLSLPPPKPLPVLTGHRPQHRTNKRVGCRGCGR
jgi:hypothetical protein